MSISQHNNKSVAKIIRDRKKKLRTFFPRSGARQEESLSPRLSNAVQEDYYPEQVENRQK